MKLEFDVIYNAEKNPDARPRLDKLLKADSRYVHGARITCTTNNFREFNVPFSEHDYVALTADDLFAIFNIADGENRELGKNVAVFLGNMSQLFTDDIYRTLWYTYVYDDIVNRAENHDDFMALPKDEFTKAVTVMTSRYIDGSYDCELDYWSNLDILFDDYRRDNLNG